MKTSLPKYNLLACFVCGFIVSSQAVFFPSIQWTPDNPIIQNLRGKIRKVRNEDALNIWCPKEYTQLEKTRGQVHPSSLYFALYKVNTKAEYDECDATKGKQLLVCNDPEGKSVTDEEYYFLHFKERPLYPNMDPHPPGKTYYFIGTSGGKDKTLHNKIGGKCASHNLKFAIYICREDEKDCIVDVLDGGWTMWRKNEETGKCERNCTNPEPQNGGKPCRGPRTSSCSQVITNQEKEVVKETITEKPTEATATATTTHESKSENPCTQSHYSVPTKEPTTDDSTTKDSTTKDSTTKDSTTKTPECNPEKKAFDDAKKDDNTGDIKLSMKGAVLTFIGLFVLGCIVGIVQVLAILHIRSKRTTKQPEPPPATPV